MKLSIKHKFAVMLLLPLVFLVCISGRDIVSGYRQLREAGALQELTRLNIAISEFVHESQKERGCTGVFLGSGGSRFRNETDAQRRLTDEKQTVMAGLLEEIDLDKYGSELRGRVDMALGQYVDVLDRHRAGVDAMSVSPVEGTGYYTRMNAALVDVSAFMPTIMTNNRLATETSAYVSFLQAKEQTGVERAVMAAVFGRGKFTAPVEIRNFVAAVAAQDAYLRTFSQVARAEHRDALAGVVRGAAVDWVAEKRRTAVERLNAEDLGQVDAGQWYTNMTAKIDLMKEVEDRLAGDLRASADRERAGAARGMIFLVVLTGVVVFASVGLMWIISRNMLRTIVTVVERAKGIAAKDLTGAPLPMHGRDELSELSGAVNGMSDSLREIVVSITSYSEQVSAAATEVAATSEEMAASSEHQRAQLTQVAAAVEEMAATVTEVSGRTGEVSRQSTDAGNQATEGGEIVRRTVEEMGQIASQVESTSAAVGQLSDKAVKIGEILTVINDIADQTNLLALNAAIEAARAGEHGRGFAVVADEVRKLAERTQEATQEVSRSINEIQSSTSQATEMMGASKDRVTSGVQLARQAGESLESIVRGSTTVAQSIDSIAAAVEEQSATSAEIARSIEVISASADEATQGANQAAAAATQLSGNAESLRELVSRFRV
jgi:methyl-accepting chemotaxis protein